MAAEPHLELTIPDGVGVVVVPLTRDQDENRAAIVWALTQAKVAHEKHTGMFPAPEKSNPERVRDDPPPRASGGRGGGSNAPKCRLHGSPMKPARGGGWFCPRQDKRTESGYCDETVEAD